MVPLPAPSVPRSQRGHLGWLTAVLVLLAQTELAPGARLSVLPSPEVALLQLKFPNQSRCHYSAQGYSVWQGSSAACADQASNYNPQPCRRRPTRVLPAYLCSKAATYVLGNKISSLWKVYSSSSSLLGRLRWFPPRCVRKSSCARRLNLGSRPTKCS